MILLYGLAVYALLGVITAIAFVIVGVTRVQPLGVSPAARVLLLPGAAARWPVVLARWLKAGRAS